MPAPRRALRPVPDQPARAIIYTRVSQVGGRGEELLSPELQETAARAHCQAHGYTVLEVLTDLDLSGRSWSKRQLEHAVRQVEAREADVIVCYRWSRFSRNLRDYAVQIGRVEAAGGRVETAVEDVDPATAAGVFQRDVLAVVAAFESNRVAEGWREVHARRVAAGLPASSGPRLGYLYDPATKTYSPDPELAPIVAGLYDQYLAGAGIRALVEHLDTRGITCPRTRRGWSITGLGLYLSSGWPAGLLATGPSRARTYLPGAHEPIISTTTWARFQAEQRTRKGLAPRQHTATHWLAGLVICDSCSRPMRRKNITAAPSRPGRKPYALYACDHAASKTRGRCPRPLSKQLADLEHAVLAWLRPLADDVTASAAAQSAHQARTAVHAADHARLTAELARADQRLVDLARGHLDGIYPTLTFTALRDQLLDARAATTLELQHLGDQAHLAQPPDPSLIRDLLDEWDTLPQQTRRDALRRLGAQVLISPPPVAGQAALVYVTGPWQRTTGQS